MLGRRCHGGVWQQSSREWIVLYEMNIGNPGQATGTGYLGRAMNTGYLGRAICRVAHMLDANQLGQVLARRAILDL